MIIVWMVVLLPSLAFPMHSGEAKSKFRSSKLLTYICILTFHKHMSLIFLQNLYAFEKWQINEIRFKSQGEKYGRGILIVERAEIIQSYDLFFFTSPLGLTDCGP